MRRSPAVAAAVLVAVLGARGASAQVGAPPRDRPNPQTPAAGTGSISGRVVDAQTGQAIARAHVRLDGMGPALPQSAATTDSSGRFAFTRLPAGRFSIGADKSTYMPARFPEPGRTLRSRAEHLSLRDGETLDSVVIAMHHGGVITGRVLDPYGDPVEGVHVMALRVTSGARPQPRFGGASNDIGEYRIARLEPGQYLLLASPQRFGGMDRTLEAPRTDPQPMPTFFPSAPSVADAQTIRVGRSTVVAADIQLLEGIPASVSGRLVDATGEPVANGSITVRPTVKDLSRGTMTVGGAGVKPDGTFQLTLAPGEYELEGRATPVAFGGPPAPGSEQTGTIAVNVTGEVSGITIELRPPAKVSGRFVFDGTSPIPPASRATGASVVFMSAEGACRSGRSEVAQDWTFTVEGVSGTCTARSYGGVGRWSVKAIMYEGVNLMDQPITFTGGQQLRGVEVVMTDRRSELTLHVTDDRGGPTLDYVALVFPADRTKWTESSDARYIRTFVPMPPDAASAAGARPGDAAANRLFVTAGAPGAPVADMAMPGATREMIVGLPAGEYYAIAVDDLDVEGFRDPAVLEQFSRRATIVSIGDGAKVDVNLQRFKSAP